MAAKQEKRRGQHLTGRSDSDETTGTHDEDWQEARDRFVVLLRHGLAEDRGPGKPDEERSLTAEGHARMKQIARGLEAVFPRAEAIWSSPLVRAMQTAQWVSKGYRSRIEVQITDALSPGGNPSNLRALIDSLQERRMILVGHEPSLTGAMLAMIGSSGMHVGLRKGGCYGARLYHDGTASLEWILSPKVLRRLGS